MLRSELHELDKAVDAIIDHDSTASQSDHLQEIDEQVAYIKVLCAGLKKKWTQELLSSAKEQVIKRYVQYHQAGLIELSDRISNSMPALLFPAQFERPQNDLYRALNLEFENVLDFLRLQFYQYFDIDHKATLYCCELLSAKIAGFEQEGKKYDGVAIDRSLIDLVFISLKEIAEEGTFSGISFRRIEQSLNVGRMLHHLLFYSSDTTTDSLTKALYQQNFNTLYFYNWYRARVQKTAESIKDKKERTEFFIGQISVFEAIFVSPEKALQPELSSTNIFILQWLQEQTGLGKVTTDKLGMETLRLNLSVPQFALFIRIFQRTGCFSTENIAMITRFFSKHFTTKKQDRISYKSFGKAFYDLDQSAAAVVRGFLQKMLNYLNKTYFP